MARESIIDIAKKIREFEVVNGPVITGKPEEEAIELETPEIEAVPWPEDFSPFAYYGLAGEIVRSVEPYTEADPAAMLMSFLSAFGCYIGDKVSIYQGGRQKPTLYILIIGDTAKARKGTSWEPIRQIFYRLDKEWTKKRITGGISSGEILVSMVRDKKTHCETDADGNKKEVIDDEGEPDKRLLIIETEFSAVLQKMQREGNTLSQILRDGWDGYQIQSHSLAHSLTGSNPTISLIAHTTAAELTKLLKEVNTFNGFSNRFLWVCTRRSKELPFAEPIPDNTYLTIVNKLQDVVNWVNSQGEIRMTLLNNMDSEVKAVWEKIYHALTKGGDDIVSYVTARSETQVIRLMLLYAILDKSAVIRIEHLRAAMAVIERSVQSVKYIYGDYTGDPIQDKIIEGLKKCGPMTQTEIYRDVFQRNTPAVKIKDALQKLSAKRKITCESEPSKGRFKKIWKLIEE